MVVASIVFLDPVTHKITKISGIAFLALTPGLARNGDRAKGGAGSSAATGVAAGPPARLSTGADGGADGGARLGRALSRIADALAAYRIDPRKASLPYHVPPKSQPLVPSLLSLKIMPPFLT